MEAGDVEVLIFEAFPSWDEFVECEVKATRFYALYEATIIKMEIGTST